MAARRYIWGNAPVWRPALALLLFCLLCPHWAEAGAIRNQLIGEEIPNYLYVGTGFIYAESDTIALNGEQLRPGVEYVFDGLRRAFDFSRLNLSGHDTLTVQYEPLPAWVVRSYGHLPDTGMVPSGQGPTVDPPAAPPQSRARKGGVSISGAKTFSFTTQSKGGDEFSQSLDVSLEGSPAPGWKLAGSISDRGYDPTYGVANSRLSELEQVSLRLTSRTFDGSVGDVVMPSAFHSHGRKRVSGGIGQVTTQYWSGTVLAARPKGRYQTARFYGEDNVQGPYQIGSSGTVAAIVPGSETVWLDGIQLSRGADQDYQMDYSAGRITFTLNHPIDSRSRVEIDYEPLAEDYRAQIYGAATGVALADSSLLLDVQWQRESDEPDQPLFGELSAADRELLVNAGDSVAWRSGIVADTAGDYVIAAENLPDTVLVYVGDGAGDYSVTFGYVGDGMGAYRYLGNGIYEFVGEGDGHYEPIVALKAPSRRDDYGLGVAFASEWSGALQAEVRASENDYNLLSDHDDGDNLGMRIDAGWSRRWGGEQTGLTLDLAGEWQDAEYDGSDRTRSADFARKFYLPTTIDSADSRRHGVATQFQSGQSVVLEASWDYLKWGREFNSHRFATEARLNPLERVSTTVAWSGVRADAADTAEGHSDRWWAKTSWQWNRGWALTGEVERDQRDDDYSGSGEGERVDRWQVGLDGASEALRFEYRTDDSLGDQWRQEAERRRLEFSSKRKLGQFDYRAALSHQWLRSPGGDETGFLMRSQYSYRPGRGTKLGGTYRLSDETRQARGVTYIEVEAGRGDYILEGGVYVPDPDGNFIEVDELLSEQARVRRAEKTFYADHKGRWGRVRLESTVEEELLSDGRRKWWWVIPVYSDPLQPYQYYTRQYRFQLHLLPWEDVHAFNYLLVDGRERRRLTVISPQMLSREHEFEMQQPAGTVLLREQLTLFETRRDSYYSGGGDFEGWRLVGEVTHRLDGGEVSGAYSYRSAESQQQGSSSTHSVILAGRLALLGQGELRGDVEAYDQRLEAGSAAASYTLTDNRAIGRGADWSLSLRYGSLKTWRANISLRGRHAESRTGRVSMRAELVAGF